MLYKIIFQSNKVHLVFLFLRETLLLPKVIFCQPFVQVLVEELILVYHQTKQEY